MLDIETWPAPLKYAFGIFVLIALFNFKFAIKLVFYFIAVICTTIWGIIRLPYHAFWKTIQLNKHRTELKDLKSKATKSLKQFDIPVYDKIDERVRHSFGFRYVNLYSLVQLGLSDKFQSIDDLDLVANDISNHLINYRSIAWNIEDLEGMSFIKDIERAFEKCYLLNLLKTTD